MTPTPLKKVTHSKIKIVIQNSQDMILGVYNLYPYKQG